MVLVIPFSLALLVREVENLWKGSGEPVDRFWRNLGIDSGDFWLEKWGILWKGSTTGRQLEESWKTGEQSWSPVRLGSSLGVLEGDLEFRRETTSCGEEESWRLGKSLRATLRRLEETVR